MPANPPAPAPIIGDAGILSPAEWQELEVLVDRPFHFETDPRNPYHNTNNNRRDAPDAATASPLSGSSTIDAKSCTADPRIDKVKLIADELANVKQVLQKAASMQETHPVWGNLTSVANVRDDDPNPLQRTKDLFAAALAIIDDPNSPLQLKYTCESDPKICLHAPSLDGTTNASVTSYFDASTNTVKFCDAFFALYPQTAAECSNDTSLSSSLQTRTGTILHELFHAIGSAAKPSKEYVFLFPFPFIIHTIYLFLEHHTNPFFVPAAPARSSISSATITPMSPVSHEENAKTQITQL